MINKNSRFYLQETSMRWTEEWTSTEYMIVRSELKMWMHPSVRNACITGCTDGAVWSVEIVLFLTLRWMQLSPSPIFRVLDWASDEIHRHHKSINISLQRGYPGILFIRNLMYLILLQKADHDASQTLRILSQAC